MLDGKLQSHLEYYSGPCKIQESCAGTLCENDTAPSPIQLQITEDTLLQEE